MRLAHLAIAAALLAAGPSHAELLGQNMPVALGGMHSTFSQRSTQAPNPMVSRFQLAPLGATPALDEFSAELNPSDLLILLGIGTAAVAWGRRRRTQ